MKKINNCVLFLLTLLIALTASSAYADDAVTADSSGNQDSAVILSDSDVPADSSELPESAAVSSDNDIPADSSSLPDSEAVSSDTDTPADSLDHPDDIAAISENDIPSDPSSHQDSIKQASVKAKDSTALDAKHDVAPPDTMPKILGTYFGFGVGLSIGSVPIFATWRGALPDTMHHLGVASDFGTTLDDVTLLQYKVTQVPDEFNFTLPFSISVHNIKENSATSFALSFFYNSKQFQSTFSFPLDTLNRRVSLYETIAYYSLSIETTYLKAIPPLFFSIDGMQQTYLSMSLGVSPVNTFARNSGVKNDTPRDDPRMQALTAHIDSVQKAQIPSSANGMSISWRLGVSTLKNYGEGGGLEMGLYYGGAYTSYFHSDGERVNIGHINPADISADKPLAFMSNRIEFKVSFLKSSSREKQVSQ